MRHLRFVSTLTILCFATALGGVQAQQPPTPEQAWSTRPVLRLYPGVAPGSEGDMRTEVLSPTPYGKGHIFRNVTTPTLTVFQPRGGNSTGTAVMICPGGAFRILAIEQEGYEVADWFAQHGVTAFVLKYRVAPTPSSDAEFTPSNQTMEEGIKKMTASFPPGAIEKSIADGVQGLKVVREHAAEYGFKEDRVVALGFSAGGGVVTGTATAPDPRDRPNYIGSIYGALLMNMPLPPKNAPPFFLAMAEDDPLVQPMVFRLFTSLRDNGGKPEFHLYRGGNHGFSMQSGGTSEHWLEELWWWMNSFGLARPDAARVSR